MQIDAQRIINASLHLMHPDQAEFLIGSEDLGPHTAVSRIKAGTCDSLGLLPGTGGCSGSPQWPVVSSEGTGRGIKRRQRRQRQGEDGLVMVVVMILLKLQRPSSMVPSLVTPGVAQGAAAAAAALPGCLLEMWVIRPHSHDYLDQNLQGAC